MYVMIQKREKTVEKGRPVEKWNNYLKCWCEVKSLYGKELYTALEAKLENVMNFETRYCKALEALNIFYDSAGEMLVDVRPTDKTGQEALDMQIR